VLVPQIIATLVMTAMPDPQTSARVNFGGKATKVNPIYNQPNRPQFHFTAKEGWLNDPNGMVFDGKQYHLFFQHNPKGTEWGNMTWGHAVSTDMLHWKQLPNALLPYSVDGRSGTIFSGSAIVDHKNVLGKQVGKTKTLVAFFTFASEPKFYQSMAYSTDGGKSFRYWNEGLAVVPHQGFDNGERDPRVFWHEESKQFVMVLWIAQNPGRFRFFTSKNLTNWDFASDFVAPWPFECPDIFFLPLDGKKSNVKCVLTDASSTYEIGRFDGKQFISEGGPHRLVSGNYYAAQTFTNTPGRVVQIGWMRGPFNASKHFDVPFNQQMSIPNELKLRTTPSGIRLVAYPIEGLKELASSAFFGEMWTLKQGRNAISIEKDSDLVEVSFGLKLSDAQIVKIELPRVTLTYNRREKRLTHTGVTADGKPIEVTTLENLAPKDGHLSLKIIVDRLSVEVYAGAGEQVGAHYIFPNSHRGDVAFTSDGAGTEVNGLGIRSLKSAWN